VGGAKNAKAAGLKEVASVKRRNRGELSARQRRDKRERPEGDCTLAKKRIFLRKKPEDARRKKAFGPEENGSEKSGG